MSTVIKRFLLWKYKSHTCEGEEVFREFLMMRTYSSGLTGRQLVGERPATIVYYACKECGKEWQHTLYGHRDKEK